MPYWNVEQIDTKALAKEHNTSQQKIAAMMYSTRNTPRAYNQLIAAGAQPGQIAPWIKRPDKAGA